MGLRLSIEVTGADRTERELLAFSGRLRNARPAFQRIAAMLREQMEELYDTEGYGEWEPLADSTLAHKAREGLDMRVLHAELDMRKSLTEEGLNHFELASEDELIFGTSDPKAPWHKTGTSRMPPRDPMMVREIDIRNFTRELQRYVVGVEQASLAAAGGGGIPFGMARTFPFGAL